IRLASSVIPSPSVASARCTRASYQTSVRPWPTPIPNRYHYGMSKQIAVRLSDELVDFIDTIAQNGDERRRMTAAQDAKILAESGPDTDLEALAGHVAGGSIDL